jgi:peptide/nickel transport system substrate-binding protein
LIGIFSFALLPRIISRLPVEKHVHKIGLVGKFSLSQLPLDVQQLIGYGLTAINEDGTVQPSLASSWTTSEDGKTYTFTLKDQIYWHDGTPVMAKDIDYNFSDVATTYLDDKTIQFQLKEAFSPFPGVVSRPIFKKGLIGTGEYRVVSLKRNGQIVEEIILKPLAKNSQEDEVIYRFYPSEEAVRTAFKLGEVDQINNLSKLGELKDWPNLEIKPEVKYNRYVAIFFNTKSEKLADKSVRQALAYALEKPWTPRAFGPINPNLWVYNPSLKQYKEDLENARKLLKSVFAPEAMPESITIELSTVPSLLEEAEKIKQDWEKIPIKTNIRVVNVIPDDFEALLVTQELSPDPDQYTLWHSTQPVTNISRFESPKIDKLLEDGRKTMDREERKEIYQDFQRFIVEETPAIFLYHPTLYTVSRK